MSTEQISLIVGVILSLVFSYVPGLKDKFSILLPNQKRVVMLVLLLVVPLSAFGLSCIGRGDFYACDSNGLWAVLESFILAAIANQATYSLTPKSEDWEEFSGAVQ